MADGEGIDLARRIGEETPEITTGLVRPMASSLTARDCRKLGVTAAIGKPIRRQSFSRFVHLLLGTALSDDDDETTGNVRVSAERARIGANVLLVEDNSVNQAVARGMLGKLGCTVVTATDGVEATDRLIDANERYDVVLMDCQMPNKDGFTAATEVRAHEQARGLAPMPIVALTANALLGDRERCIAAGMDDYLSKPYTLEALQEVIERNLAASAAAPIDADVASA